MKHCFVAMFILFAIQIQAEPLRVGAESGYAELEAGELDAAMAALLPRAESGDEFAQTAVEAMRGDREAQYRLGLAYSRGSHVDRDHEQAVRWLLMSAEQGHAVAQRELARKYDSGWGVPENGTEALRWFSVAAEQGDGEAQFELARKYARGFDVEQDFDRAAHWYLKAFEQGEAREALRGLSWLYKEGADRAVEFATGLQAAAETGGAKEQITWANFLLSALQEEGAFFWYLRAAEAGSGEARLHVARAYEFGIGVPENNELARAWYQRAAESGNEEAREYVHQQERYFLTAMINLLILFTLAVAWPSWPRLRGDDAHRDFGRIGLRVVVTLALTAFLIFPTYFAYSILGWWVATTVSSLFSIYFIIFIFSVITVTLCAVFVYIVRKSVLPSEPSNFRKVMRNPVIVSVSLAALECFLIVIGFLPKPSFLL